MERVTDILAAGIACAVLSASIFLPEPWSLVAASTWALGISSYILWRRRTRGVEAASMELLDRGASPDIDRTSSTTVVVLELRCSQFIVSRFDENGQVENTSSTAQSRGSFPIEFLSAVLSSEFAGHRSLTAWSLASVPVTVHPGHPAARAYGELLGPLEITGRFRHVLELHIDAAALPSYRGTVTDAAASVRRRIQGLLAHSGIATAVVSSENHAAIRQNWASAPHEKRMLVSAKRDLREPGRGHYFALISATESLAPGQPFEPMTSHMLPAQGAGPIIGADEQDAALCLDLCGAHIHTAALAGRFDSLEFLILRQCALGWRAIAVTDIPDRWHGLAVSAGVDVVYSHVSIAGERRSALLRELDHALLHGCDVVFWDSTLEIPDRLLDRRAGLTVCRILTGDSEDIERQFTQRRIQAADLLIDGRVAGWFTIHTRADITGDRPRSITVQAVETAAEIACLAAGRAAPQPLATLTVST